MEKMEYLSPQWRMHQRINSRVLLHDRYHHPNIGQIVNNVLYKIKDETNKLLWRH